MPFEKIIIEASIKPNQLRIGIEGTPSENHPFFTIHLFHLGEVREELIWWTALNPDQLGTPLKSEIENLHEDGLYCVYIATEETYQIRNTPNKCTLEFIQHFRFKNKGIHLIDEIGAIEARKKMAEKAISPMYADGGKDHNAKSFQVEVFYAGVSVHNSSSSSGFTIHPIHTKLSNINTFEAVSEYLIKNHAIIIPDRDQIKPYLNYKPLFSITFHNILSNTADNAIKFAEQTAVDIATIIASERGDRPEKILSLLIDKDSGNYILMPKNFDLRENLAPPLFENEHTQRIEKIFPIINKHPFARLILELFTQALAERDKSFRFFRQWSLLEMIADRKISPTETPLKNLDDSIIMLSKGKPLNTKRKEGKVYAYLRGGNLPPIYQGTLSGSTDILEGSKGPQNFTTNTSKFISLWEAVAACYKIRNAVAHEGIFIQNKEPKNARERLSSEIFDGHFGFLDHALAYAIWKEISEHKDR